MKSGNVGSPLIIFVSIFLSSGGNFETSYKNIILLIFDVVALLQKILEVIYFYDCCVGIIMLTR